jgi:hypothetical protein
MGMCSLRPITCDDRAEAACGCDHITYWNDCLRRQSGIEAATPGDCSVGLPCRDAPETECGSAEAYCARLFVLPPLEMCDPMLAGSCWVLPPTCPMNQPPERWVSCSPMMGPGPGPGPGPTGPCLRSCEAIRAGKPARMLSKKLPDCP